MSAKPFPTNYAGHEELYRRRRREGATGWDSEETTGENIAAIERLLAQCNVDHGGAMIELGCGAGNLTSYFASRGWKAQGVDISPCAIDWARERAGQAGLAIDFHVGNVLDLSAFPANAFDLVLDGHCFHCIIGVDRQTFLQQVRDRLKPNGHLLLMSMAGEPPKGLVGGQLDPETRCQVVDGVATRYFGDADVIVSEVEAAGFRVSHSTVEPRRDESHTDHLLLLASPLGEGRTGNGTVPTGP